MTEWGLFFNIVSFAVYTLLPSVFQCLDPIGLKRHQRQNRRHHVNFSTSELKYTHECKYVYSYARMYIRILIGACVYTCTLHIYHVDLIVIIICEYVVVSMFQSIGLITIYNYINICKYNYKYIYRERQTDTDRQTDRQRGMERELLAHVYERLLIWWCSLRTLHCINFPNGADYADLSVNARFIFAFI